MVIIRKIFKSLIFVFLIVFLINSYMIFDSSFHMYSFSEIDKLEKKDYDYILVLGASVIKNSVPSPILKNRLDLANKLYKINISKKIIQSGDGVDNYYNEVNVMKNYSMANGISEKDIILDRFGLSTFDSVFNAKEIYKAKKIVIVTQKFHLYRAIYLAKKMGIDVVGVYEDSLTNNFLLWIKNISREIFARTKDFVYINLFKEI